jgi:acylphosphatase
MQRCKPSVTPLPPLPMPSTPKLPPQCPTDLIRRYRVSGKVQGVYFRHSTRIEAIRLGLRGTVRNLSDGSVEVVAHGAPAAVETLRAWLHRGPALARVDTVSEIAPAEAGDVGIPQGFEVL